MSGLDRTDPQVLSLRGSLLGPESANLVQVGVYHADRPGYLEIVLNVPVFGTVERFTIPPRVAEQALSMLNRACIEARRRVTAPAESAG